MKKNKKVLAGVLAASMLTFGGVGSAFAATTSTAANGTTAYYIGTASSGTEYTSSYLLANPGTISTINSQLNSGFGLYFSLMGQPFINYKNFINSLNGQTPTTSALNVYATQSANQFTPPANTPVDGSTPALSVSSVSAINSTIAVGGSTGFTFKDSSGNAVTPTGVNYTVTSSNASTGFINSSGVFTATAAGAYTIQAAIGSTDLTTTVNVYGQAASVSLVFPNNSAALTANGATDQVTVKVLDANGNVVSNFNGTLNVTLTTPGTYHGTLVNAYGGTFSNPITITNGVGTIYLTTPTTQNTSNPDVLAVSNLASTNGQAVSSSLTYGSSNVTYTASSATQLKFATSTATLSNSSASNKATLTLNVADAQGVTVNPLSQTTYVTLTLNGPGSFTQLTTGSSTPVTSETVTASAAGTYSVDVYPVVGQTGTITVSAASTGLTSASATVNLVTAGLVSTFAVNSTTGTLNSAGAADTGLPAGSTYTLYTVQFADVNGNPVAAPASDALTVTDNSQSLSGTTGTLKYYSYNPTATDPFSGTTLLGTSSSGTPATFNPTLAATGTSTFAVFNTSSGTTNPTITVTDSGLGISKTASYTYVIGSAAAVAAASTQANPVTLTPGGSSTVSFQLTDAAGNPVAQSGVTVNVWFTTSLTGVTISSSQVAPTSITSPYQATTNAQGIATVTVNAASSTASNTFAIGASIASTGSAQATVNGSVTSLTNAINTVGYGTVSGSPATFTPDSSTSLTTTAGIALNYGGSYKIYGLNAIGAPVASTSDTLLLTVSNKNILAITPGGGWTVGSTGTTATQTASTSGISLPTITAGLAGTATITITDISVPSQPSVTLNVTVTPGVGTTTAFVSNGAAITSSAPLTLAANTPATLNLNYVDAGGNPVAVTTTPSGITFALSDGAKGGTFSATSGGSPIYQVNIPNGQSSATVYYKNPSAGSYSSFSAAPAIINTVYLNSLTASTTTSTSIAITGTLKDQNGNPFAGATVYISSNNASGAVNGVTGTTTAPVSVTANSSGVFTFTYKTTSSTATDNITFEATSGGSAITTTNGTSSGTLAISY